MTDFTSTNDGYDVVVIGSGPAGLSAALAAAECGASVLLCERNGMERYILCHYNYSPLNIRLKQLSYHDPQCIRIYIRISCQKA